MFSSVLIQNITFSNFSYLNLNSDNDNQNDYFGAFLQIQYSENV